MSVGNNLLQIQLLRQSGHVRRVHTFKHHGEYRVSDHSYNALTILLHLYPGDPSMTLVRALLHHDCGERVLGDLPATAKWRYPLLGELYETVERDVIQNAHPQVHAALEALTPAERAWLRVCDGLELLFWCSDQMELGNKAEPMRVAFRIMRALRAIPDLPGKCRVVLDVIAGEMQLDRFATEEEVDELARNA